MTLQPFPVLSDLSQTSHTGVVGNPPRLNRKAFRRALNISVRFGVVYVNNPKVASSTIKLTLQRAELGDPDYRPPRSVHQMLDSPLLTFPEIGPPGTHIPDWLEGRYVFSMVRNPFARLMSVYLNKVLMAPAGTTEARQHAGFRPDYCPSFEEFVLSVATPERRDANPHWRSQSVNLCLDKIRYDYIGRMEGFDAAWADLSAATGLPPVAARAGVRTPMARKRSLTFTPAMETAVAATWAEDFARFGYPASVQHLRDKVSPKVEPSTPGGN